MADGEGIVVRTESHEADARIVVGFLQSLGIEARISEDDAGDQLPSLEGTHGVKIVVAPEHADRAIEALTERDNADDASDDEDQD